MHPRRPRRTPAGFTLIEVALAAAVMALGIATSITVLQRGFALLDTARSTTTAAQIMASQMEQMRMLDWATVSAYPASATTVPIDAAFTSNASVGTRFSMTRTTSTPETDLLQISFTVSWTAHDGRTLSRTMTTYYARYGIHDYIYNGS